MSELVLIWISQNKIYQSILLLLLGIWFKFGLINKFRQFFSMKMGFYFMTVAREGPDSKVHGANVGPGGGRQDPSGSHVGHMNFAIWDVFWAYQYCARFLESSAMICSDRSIHSYTNSSFLMVRNIFHVTGSSLYQGNPQVIGGFPS